MENRQPTPTSESEKPKPDLLSLPEILFSLADVFKFNMSDRALNAYLATVGHRTDADLNKAYHLILRDSRFMPTPSELLESCGIPKVFRDGSRPE